ncbi:MAG TPA: DUF4097 family beta strand repeat-containing protein [Puia sp.]|nr:DUF4097 family beta strand repeat-containing protein [Puia sp.]
MQKKNILIGLIFGILSAGFAKAQTDNKEQLVVPLSSPGKPFSLTMNILNGSIKLSGYDGKDIIIDIAPGEVRNKNEEETVNGMHKISRGGEVDITAEEKNNTVEVNAGNAKKTVILKIPQEAVKLKLGTVNEGSIYVENVNGELEITNVNGAITAKGISGSVVANTVNGNVIVTFKSIKPDAPMAFTTLNGDVDVTFPGDAKANVKLKSDRGEIFTDFNMAIDQAKPKVTKSSEDNMYRLNVEDWVYGKINGGGPDMMLKNMNGNIYVRKSK